MKSLLIILFLELLGTVAFTQTGPGGVGKTDGSSDLVLWLGSDSIPGATNGSTITTWGDSSGYGYDFGDGNGAVYYKNVQNGYPAFKFNGSTHYFERAFESNLTPSEFTVFVVDNVTGSNTWKAAFSNRDDPAGSATAGFILYSAQGNNKWEFWTGHSSGTWLQLKSKTSTVGDWSCQTVEYQSGSNGKKIYIAGKVKKQANHAYTKNPNRPFRIGSGRNEQSTPDYYFKGYIAEVIMFKRILNSAEQIIVQNYLSAKYDYALDKNDTYNEDKGSAGDYDHEVAGIGRVDASNILDDAQGTGIVRINNPTDLDNNEFLIWGHDNGALDATETTDVPSGVEARLERIWRVSETKANGSGSRNVGDVDISFDLTGLGAVTASDLRLLIDSDNDGSFSDETPISGAVAESRANVYKFSGVSGGTLRNNRRFTLGTVDTNQTPLPIELVKFIAKKINNDVVKIDWQTITEVNNNYFTIQRSVDALKWENIKNIKGAGNSNEEINYTVLDKNPLRGTSYYRLKQTDFDGRYSYSDIVAITIKEDAHLLVYPNPTENRITIMGTEYEISNVKIYNTLGQNMTPFTKIKENGRTKKIIDISKLPKGLYFVKTKTASHQILKQ